MNPPQPGRLFNWVVLLFFFFPPPDKGALIKITLLLYSRLRASYLVRLPLIPLPLGSTSRPFVLSAAIWLPPGLCLHEHKTFLPHLLCNKGKFIFSPSTACEIEQNRNVGALVLVC